MTKNYFVLYFIFVVSLNTYSSVSKDYLSPKVSGEKEFVESLKPLQEALNLVSKNQNSLALVELNKWNSKQKDVLIYKDFWSAQWGGNQSNVWQTYLKLKKEKKFLRLRLSLFRMLVADEKDLDRARVLSNSELKKEARIILRQLRGTSEGELFESEYLDWLNRNQEYTEICKSEKNRWLGEGENDYKTTIAGLKNCPPDFEDFLFRLRRLIFAARDSQASEEIESYSQEFKLPDWQRVYARSIFESNVGQPNEAFEKLIKYEKEIIESDFASNYFYIAQRAGQSEKAEKIIGGLIKKASNQELRELQFEQGFLFYHLGRYKEAFFVFDRLFHSLNGKKFKRGQKKEQKEFDQLGWLRAWCLYLNNDIEEALTAFRLTEDTTNDQARLTYWTAMAQLKLNQSTTAYLGFKKLSQPIADQKPFSFYNILGWLRVQSLKKQVIHNAVIKNLLLTTQSQQDFYPTPDENLTRSQMLEHYNQLTDESFSTDEGDIQVVNTENEVILSDELSGIEFNSSNDLQIQLAWVRFLNENKLDDLAKWHLYELERKITTRKNSEQLILHYLESQNYYRSLSLMQRVSDLRNVTTSFKSDPILWRALYPEAYKEIVLEFTQQRKMDPYFLWSIMRAETQYKSDAISPVGAVGLMQFMAYTMKRLGPLIERNDLVTDLFVPRKSIEYGAAYLKKLSIEMDFQLPLVAASYNGGPHRVKSWLKNRGTIDFDVFIEHIPFAETRTYVKRVIATRSIYEKIYSAKIESTKLNYLIQPISFKAPEKFSLNEEWNPFSEEMKKTNNTIQK